MEQLANRLDDIQLDKTNNPAATPCQQQQQVQDVESSEKWGMPLSDLYRLGLSFFKGKNSCIIFSHL